MHDRVRGLVVAVAVAMVLAACGTTKIDETGPVDARTVEQLEALLRTRADAMGRGDLAAFKQTIDMTRPAFRRMQQAEFDVPTARVTLKSTFKMSNAERYQGYVRGFVEETLEGNGYLGSFAGVRSYARYYFRQIDGRWLLSEPSGSEVGEERKVTSGENEITYWTMDEDVAGVFAKEASDAHAFATKQAPKSVSFTDRVKFVPTAELAGPGWDAMQGGSGNPIEDRFYNLWYGFDASRSHLSPYSQLQLRLAALGRMREVVLPGIGAKLSNDVWLDGWTLNTAGVDLTAFDRQLCAGIPALTLRQLSDGPPQLGTPGLAAETWGRYYAYSQSMVAYLVERFGADSYWRLLDAYTRTPSSATNFPAVLKTTPDDFYSAWLAWEKKKYC